MTTNRWSELTGGASGADYAARFAELAAAGSDLHGEAALCAELVPAGSRALDAGCGTGRVAARLAQLGYDCVGVDADASMLAQARAAAPDLRWLLADLAALDSVAPELAGGFDLVVAAGNVLPLLAPGTERTVLAHLRAQLRPAGLLVAGFGLDPEHLPLSYAPLQLDDYDRWCAEVGLTLLGRYSTWQRAPYRPGDGYAVSVHQCGGAPGRPVGRTAP